MGLGDAALAGVSPLQQQQVLQPYTLHPCSNPGKKLEGPPFSKWEYRVLVCSSCAGAPGRTQAWRVLTSKQGLGLPDCRLQLLWGQDLAWKWLCCPFHPEGKWTREMTLLPELTPYLAHRFLPLLCKS